MDSKRGEIYYYNTTTGETQWNCPVPPPPPPPPPPLPPPPPPEPPLRRSPRGRNPRSSLADQYEAEKRVDRIAQIQGMLQYTDDRKEKAELNGELHMLQRQQYVYSAAGLS